MRVTIPLRHLQAFTHTLRKQLPTLSTLTNIYLKRMLVVNIIHVGC